MGSQPVGLGDHIQGRLISVEQYLQPMDSEQAYQAMEKIVVSRIRFRMRHILSHGRPRLLRPGIDSVAELERVEGARVARRGHAQRLLDSLDSLGY